MGATVLRSVRVSSICVRATVPGRPGEASYETSLASSFYLPVQPDDCLYLQRSLQHRVRRERKRHHPTGDALQVTLYEEHRQLPPFLGGAARPPPPFRQR